MGIVAEDRFTAGDGIDNTEQFRNLPFIVSRNVHAGGGDRKTQTMPDMASVIFLHGTENTGFAIDKSPNSWKTIPRKNVTPARRYLIKIQFIR